MPFLPLWRRGTRFRADSHASCVDPLCLRPIARIARSVWRLAVVVFTLSAAGLTAAEMDESQFNAELEAQAQTNARLDAELQVEVLELGASSRRLRRSLSDELPLDRLDAGTRQLVTSVVDQVSLHRRMPVVRCETDPRVVQFFLEHPDVAVGIWRAMQVSDMQLDWMGGNKYRTDGGDGSSGVITLLWTDGRQYLVHCQGDFQSPVLTRPIQASAIFWLQTESQQDAQGRQFSKCTADVFIAFPSNAIEAAARIISPVSNKIADRNFQEVAMFIRMMHLAMTRQPGWVEQTAGSLQGVQRERSQALVDTAAHVYVDAQQRLAATTQKSLTPEGLRLPIRRESEVEAASTAGETPPAPTQLTARPVESQTR